MRTMHTHGLPILRAMRTLPRPLRIAMLWLLVALLPLRAWAQAGMTPADAVVLPAALAAASAQVASATAGHAPLPACHAGLPQAQPGHDTGLGEPPPVDAAPDADAHAACPSCDLCHGGMVTGLPAPTLALHPVAGEAPMRAQASGLPEGGASRLFRPPRSRRT